MIVTAWKSTANPITGGGYGLKVRVEDRDRYFRREWRTVTLELEGSDRPVEVKVGKPSFWNETCHELTSQEIGRWLLDNGYAPWPKGNPPKFIMEVVADRRYVVRRIKDDKPSRSK